MRLLVTRPQPDGERTAAALRARGHAVLLQPMLHIEAQHNVQFGPGPWAAVALTSSQAARVIAAHKDIDTIRQFLAFTVGRRSAEAARDAGFVAVHAAEGDASALARLVTAKLADRARPILYLAGEERTADLEGLLAAQGFSVHTAVVYRAVAESRLSDAVAAALRTGEIDAVLHFSARSAEAFLAAAATAELSYKILKLRHYCLSEAVAARLAQAGISAPPVAAAPNEQALLDLIEAG